MNPRRAERGRGPKRNVASHRSQRNNPVGRRFHRHPRDKCGRLRRWDIAIWWGLHSGLPGRRFCANLLSDALHIIYRSRHRPDVERELAWLLAEGQKNDICAFDGLAEVFDIEPERVRGDVLGDVRGSLIVAKGVICA